jgi:hypothetical protein
MSRQVVGPWVDLLTATAADNGRPLGAVGLLVSDELKAVPYSVDWQVWIGINGVGDVSADLYLHGRDDEDNVWGILSQIGTDTIEGTVTPSSPPVASDQVSYYFGFQNIVAGFDRLYVEVLNLTGTNVSVTAKIRPIYNCETNGLAG